jgi:hypothetical protein
MRIAPDFSSLVAVSSYGKSARAIIPQVIDDLASQAPDDCRVISPQRIQYRISRNI